MIIMMAAEALQSVDLPTMLRHSSLSMIISSSPSCPLLYSLVIFEEHFQEVSYIIYHFKLLFLSIQSTLIHNLLFIDR